MERPIKRGTDPDKKVQGNRTPHFPKGGAIEFSKEAAKGIRGRVNFYGGGRN